MQQIEDISTRNNCSGILLKNYDKNTYRQTKYIQYWRFQYYKNLLKQYKSEQIENAIYILPDIYAYMENKNIKDILSKFDKKLSDDKNLMYDDFKTILIYNNSVRAEVKKIINQLLLIEIPKPKPKMVIEKNIEKIIEIMNYDENTASIFRFFSIVMHCKIAYDSSMRYSTNRSSIDYYKTDYYKFLNIKNYTKIDKELIDTIDYLSRSVIISEKFSTNLIGSYEDLLNSYCTKCPKSKLKLSDFSHVKDIAFLESLITNAIKQNKTNINILIYGKPGTGKTELTKVLCDNLNLPLYSVISNNEVSAKAINIERMQGSDTNNFNQRIQYINLLNRFISNKKSVLLVDEAENIFDRFEEKSDKLLKNKLLENNSLITIYIMNDIFSIDAAQLRRFSYILEMNEIPNNAIENLATKIFEKNNIMLDNKIINFIKRTHPSVGLIENAVNSYKLSGSKNKEDIIRCLESTIKASNYGSVPKKNNVFNKSIFLPELLNTNVNLKEISEEIINSNELNFSILSYGCPGSSKTSFARYLAGKLNIPVIQKNYQELVSCFVGETERNISELFKEGSEEKAMIILDEADILLKDRKTAKNIWEISQTEALLTELEEYDYPVIMTTNLFDNIDEAAMRRFDFKIKHDYLNEEQVKIAFKHFLNIIPKSNISELNRLTPGDFITIIKRMRFSSDKSEKKYIEELKSEMMIKKDSFNNKIGF